MRYFLHKYEYLSADVEQPCSIRQSQSVNARAVVSYIFFTFEIMSQLLCFRDKEPGSLKESHVSKLNSKIGAKTKLDHSDLYGIFLISSG